MWTSFEDIDPIAYHHMGVSDARSAIKGYYRSAHADSTRSLLDYFGVQIDRADPVFTEGPRASHSDSEFDSTPSFTQATDLFYGNIEVRLRITRNVEEYMRMKDNVWSGVNYDLATMLDRALPMFFEMSMVFTHGLEYGGHRIDTDTTVEYRFPTKFYYETIYDGTSRDDISPYESYPDDVYAHNGYGLRTRVSDDVWTYTNEADGSALVSFSCKLRQIDPYRLEYPRERRS